MYSGTFFISGPETFSSLFYPNLFVLAFNNLPSHTLEEVSYKLFKVCGITPLTHQPNE